MASNPQTARNSVELQAEMFRLAEAEHGLSLAVLARTRNIPASTLKGWRDGSAMPAWALGALDLPDDLTSLILNPFGKRICTIESENGDYDALGLEALGLGVEVAKARSPDSPGGVAIVHTEEIVIKKRARKVSAKASGVGQ